MSNTWDNVTGAEERLMPILDLVIEIGPRAGLRTEQQATLRDASQLRRELGMAASRHSAGPNLAGWATLKNAGDWLGLSARTLTRWCETGKGPGRLPIRAVQIGRDWLINEDDARKAAQHGHGDD